MANRVPKKNFPLQGKRFILTQSTDQIDKLEKFLSIEQASVIRIPTIEFELVKHADPIRQAIRNIENYDLLILTSQNSFLFFQRLLKEEKVYSLPSTVKIAVIGDETKNVMEQHGFKVSFVPQDQKNSDTLAEFLAEKMALQGKKVLFPKSSLSHSKLPERLKKMGAWVDDPVLYQTMVNSSSKNIFNYVYGSSIDWILFSSPSAVKGFFSFLTPEEVQAWIFDLGIKIGSIGDTTTKALLEFKIPVSVQSPRPSSKMLIQTIKDFENYDDF